MLEKGKISAVQLAVLMYPTILATGFLLLPSITAKYAGNDLWIATLLASVSGFVAIFAAYRLHKLYPEYTVIEYGEQILGRVLGKIVGFVFVIFYLHTTGVIAREYAQFVVGSFFFRTPMIFVICSMILLCAVAVRGGVELVARSAQILTPVFILPLAMLLLLIPDLDVRNIFPVLEHGFVPVLQGAATPQAWFSEYFLISFFLPFLAKGQKGAKWSTISLSAAVASLLFTNLIVYFLFGEDTATKNYPVLIAFRYISLAEFIENLEAVLLAAWVIGSFIKIAVFYYAAALSAGQWLNLSDYRPVVLPLGILIVAFSYWDLPNFPQLAKFLSTTGPFYILTTQAAIPLLLLLVAVLRKRKRRPKGASAP
ncbi:endospore germination permease [Paenibacillus sp. GCM10027626]|uniref:GerAB/ArcD/ProY family transporter n=1 Tax=Paenibacillus sp. GCM10027626 TaxID=3273411 RepID=UPI00362BE86C